jgi:hypothetical protein
MLTSGYKEIEIMWEHYRYMGNDYKIVWKQNGEEFDLDAPENERIWESIASYMDDDIRESVHAELAPCTNTEFLNSYLEKDPDFEENILHGEFGIDLDYE